MRDPKRIKPLLEKLENIWTKNPDFRLGQLIMVITKTGEHNPKLFNMEEEEFERKIEELENLLKKKMIANFKIISFTEIELNGIEFDLHNNFEFLADETEVLESTIKLYFKKSSESWAKNVKANKLIFILENYNFLKQIEPQEEYLEDDLCLSGITFFDNDFRDEDYCLMNRAIPKENDDIIFSFESERVIRVNCETITCIIE